MSAWKRVGLRGRLALALAGVALLSVGLSMVLADSGLHSRLDQAARERLQSATAHTAQLAAGLYQQQHGWTTQTVTELGHVAGVSGYRLSLYDASGRLRAGPSHPGPSHPSGPRARAAVANGGRSVGTVVLTPLQGQVLTGEDRQLQSRLNTLHLLAGGIALAAGLLAALLLAAPLARPLRQLTGAARRIERGELDIRVRTAGPPETVALGRAFNRLAETLEHEEQIRRAAAADVAHELRTPLTGIVSRIEAAQDGVLADQERNLEAMHTEALRLAQLVGDLGKLADAEQPGLTVAKQDVDLTAVVSERAVAYRELVAAKEIALEQQLTPARAWGDPRRIAQIIDNLLSNALRYTEHGGRITVAASQRDGEAIIEVADNGVGISGDDLPYIFERFWRAEQSRARKTGGAGIGLSIVRELVRAHDGRIDVQSKPGQGSRFTVTLPARAPSH
jgi:two-component system, OmpR family, sensor histidine kinase BaeS